MESCDGVYVISLLQGWPHVHCGTLLSQSWGALLTEAHWKCAEKFSSFLSFAPEMRPQSWGSGGRTPQTQSSSVAGVWGSAWPITWQRAAWRMWCCWRSPSWRLDPPGTLYVWQSSRFYGRVKVENGRNWAKCTFLCEIQLVSAHQHVLRLDVSHKLLKSMIGSVS